MPSKPSIQRVLRSAKTMISGEYDVFEPPLLLKGGKREPRRRSTDASRLRRVTKLQQLAQQVVGEDFATISQRVRSRSNRRLSNLTYGPCAKER